MTLEKCKGCDQLFSVTLTKQDESKEKQYHCRADCYVIIEKVKPEKCTLNNKHKKKESE